MMPSLRTFQGLGRHVADSAGHVLTEDGSRVSAAGLGDSKIDELDLPTYQDEIGGLQIRMYHTFIVHRLHHTCGLRTGKM
jgi:hypothetical protein